MKTKTSPFLSALILSVTWFAAAATQAAAITVENPSFENPTQADGAFLLGTVPGWTLSSGAVAGVWNPQDAMFSGSTEPRSGLPDGKQCALLDTPGTLTQTLSATLQAGTDYTLRVAVGDRKDFGSGSYAVELHAGDQVLGTANPPAVNGAWVVASVRYRAEAGNPNLGKPLRIVLRKLGNVAGEQVDFDNVQLDASPIGDVPVGQGLVAHWKFDEAGGTVARDVMGRYDGQLVAEGATFVPGGIAGGAVRLDRSTNGMVVVPYVAELGTGDFSAVAWAKLSAGDVTGPAYLLTQHEAWAVNGWLLLLSGGWGWGAPGKATLMMENANETVVSSTAVNDGQWHQIVATYAKGGTLSLYVDGAPAEASRPSVPCSNRTPPFLMGGIYGDEVASLPLGKYTGWIDDVQIYNRALTDSEVDNLFRHPGQNLADLTEPLIIDPNGGEFATSISVSLISTRPGATIRYTLDGTDPLATSPAYQAPLTLRATTTLKARLFTGESPTSDIVSALFAKLPSVSIQPPGGMFITSVQVTLVNNLGLGNVVYTTDGSEPGVNSPGYTAPLTITNALTLKTRILYNGFPISDVYAATFTRAADIVFTPTPGVFPSAVDVVILNTVGAGVARFTLDGTTPTADSPAYAQPIHLTAATTIKAQVFLESFPISEVFEAFYQRLYAFNDGIPDAWQEQYFGPGYMTDPRSAADADPDNDGTTNAQEYAAGTNPTDPLSGFTAGIRAVPLVSWTSIVGQKYRILRKPVVTAPDWTLVVDNYLATNTSSQYVDVEAQGIQFYVIEVVP